MHTRHLEGVVGRPVGVRVPPSAPENDRGARVETWLPFSFSGAPSGLEPARAPTSRRESATLAARQPEPEPQRPMAWTAEANAVESPLRHHCKTKKESGLRPRSLSFFPDPAVSRPSPCLFPSQRCPYLSVIVVFVWPTIFPMTCRSIPASIICVSKVMTQVVNVPDREGGDHGGSTNPRPIYPPGVVSFGSALSTICRNVSITGELRFSECLARKIGRFKDMPVTGILTRCFARNSDRSPWTDMKESPMPARTSALHVSGQARSMAFRIVAFLDDSQCSKSRRVAEPFSRVSHNSSSSELGAM